MHIVKNTKKDHETDSNAMIISQMSYDLTRKDIVKWISRHKFTRVDATVNDIVILVYFTKIHYKIHMI